MITYGYKMHYALSFAKERFAAVSETTKDKVRREWGMFPLLKINLKPFSAHPSIRRRGVQHLFILQWICK